MKLLLDTCALLALAGQAGKLSRPASKALSSADRVCVCPVTAWEIAIKAKTGKLQMTTLPYEWFTQTLERYHIEELPLTTALLCTAADLPLIHRDPFDRVIITTALAQNFTILTSDRIIPTYPAVKTLW